MMGSPFDLADTASYRRWREQKLDSAPRRIEDIVVALDDLIFTQVLPSVADALTGLNVIFPAMPRTDEMHLAFIKILTLIGTILCDDVHDLGH